MTFDQASKPLKEEKAMYHTTNPVKSNETILDTKHKKKQSKKDYRSTDLAARDP